MPEYKDDYYHHYPCHRYGKELERYPVYCNSYSCRDQSQFRVSLSTAVIGDEITNRSA